MDTQKFDAIAKSLAVGKSRRSVIGSMFGGALAMAGFSRVAGKPADKVDTCHFDDETGSYHWINVSGNALDAHLAHGDAEAGDIGSSVEHCLGCGVGCEARDNATVSCSNGDCMYTCNEGYEDAEGACVEAVTCAEIDADSTFGNSCYDELATCTPEGLILSAMCENAEQNAYLPTTINVNDCAAQGYYIANCDGSLTCGEC